jgi:gamma-D-glutamyl-L-lysine dipeptidyl-peptidase
MAQPPPPEKLICPVVAPLFKEPDPLSEQVSQALLATHVLDLRGDEVWRVVRTPDGYEGWVSAQALAPAPEGWQGPWAEVEDLWANLRARPDHRRAAVTQATIGVRLPLVKEEEGWVRLRTPGGEELWTEAHRVQRVAKEPHRPARRFLGIPYLWGGGSHLGLDCSGFVQLVMRLHGIALQRDSIDQSRQGMASPEPDTADLVFFGPAERPGSVTHVGMMLDRRRFIHAKGSDRVRINLLTDDPYPAQFRCARRFL